jgi:hypothetical protein
MRIYNCTSDFREPLLGFGESGILVLSAWSRIFNGEHTRQNAGMYISGRAEPC